MTFTIDFLGCKVNSYEADCLAEELEKEGYTLFLKDEDAEPDIVIVNTCAVTETSVAKDRKMIRSYKRRYPDSILVVMGCYAQYMASYIASELKADIVLGTDGRKEIPELIERFKRDKKTIVIDGSKEKGRPKYEDISLSTILYNTRAYVKIQDGCDNFCTYCLIPFVRGRSRSRPKESVLLEVARLVKNGYKEIVLTGIDMCSYGKDLYEDYTFSDLIGDILKNERELYRLRISSIEESEIDDKFISLLERYPNLADHLHVPLQSGSVEVLKRMRRHYDLKSFASKIARIRSVRPSIAITTDVIVGFPGESDEEFEETFAFCKVIKFAKIHVFPYSKRSGTLASKMPDQIDPKVKKERVEKLIALSNALEREYASSYFGEEVEFLFESYDEKRKGYHGHSSNYLACFLSSQKDLKGKVIKVVYNKDISSFNFDNV
jgi:threonylcarbamoyladenosine tRNA methylthiotransferase MtaB